MKHIQETFDEIVRGHRTVRDCTVRILGSHEIDEVFEAIDRLAEVLPRHFAYEESEHGFFAHLRRHLGERASEVDALVEDHERFRTEIEALTGPGDRDDAWLARAKRFARMLRSHEQKESRLGAGPA